MGHKTYIWKFEKNNTISTFAKQTFNTIVKQNKNNNAPHKDLQNFPSFTKKNQIDPPSKYIIFLSTSFLISNMLKSWNQHPHLL